MTLIAGFWCAGDQAVLLADSCESWGSYKTSVTKITPQAIGDLYQVAYAGSGLSDLIDAFGEALELSLSESRASGPLSLQKVLAKTLVDFYDSPEIAAYPRDTTDPNSFVSGVVCIRVVPISKVFLFKFSRTVVLPVKDYVLRGMEEPIYSHIVKRLYRPGILPLQARLLGLHVMSEAASTSNQIDHPMRVVFAMTHGMFSDDSETDHYLQALSGVQRAMDDVLIACADTHAVKDHEVRQMLKLFGQRIVKARREFARGHTQRFKEAMRPVLPSPKRGRKSRPASQG